MVKCAKCGFLAARHIETRKLEETEEAFRESGRPPVVGFVEGAVSQFRHEELPLCFARRYDLRDEFKEFAGKDTPDNLSVHHVLHEERDCAAFTKWQQGLTPKEHREMLDRQEWRDWQERQRKEDKRWRIIELIVIGIIAVLVAGGFTVLGAFIERGSVP